MAIQFSTITRSAMLDAWESQVGGSPILSFRTGSPPADCGTTDSGTLMASITLNNDWASAASSGVKSVSGLPLAATITGNTTAAIAHYRLYDVSNVCHMQGTVSTSTSSDFQLDAVVYSLGQTIALTSWSITAGNS